MCRRGIETWHAGHHSSGPLAPFENDFRLANLFRLAFVLYERIGESEELSFIIVVFRLHGNVTTALLMINGKYTTFATYLRSKSSFNTKCCIFERNPHFFGVGPMPSPIEICPSRFDVVSAVCSLSDRVGKCRGRPCLPFSSKDGEVRAILYTRPT
jgi:hypothetical protein